MKFDPGGFDAGEPALLFGFSLRSVFPCLMLESQGLWYSPAPLASRDIDSVKRIPIVIESYLALDREKAL